MKWISSRDSRSSLATMTGALRLRANFNASASLGPRSSASEPLPVSISVNVPDGSSSAARSGPNWVQTFS
jgi:hypothetical protein